MKEKKRCEQMKIFDVANYILNSVGGEISAMKLQKLCYYSQAWTLAWDDKELFPEEFLRWDNGPVCRELFDIHQGMFMVNSKLIEEDLLSEIPTDGERRNIDQILEDYGQYSGSDLSEMIHAEKPWKDTQRNQIITKDCMKKYYSGLINGNNRESTITDAEFATFMAEMLEDYTAKRLLAEGGHRASPLVRDMIADYRIRAKIKK